MPDRIHAPMLCERCEESLKRQQYECTKDTLKMAGIEWPTMGDQMAQFVDWPKLRNPYVPSVSIEVRNDISSIRVPNAQIPETTLVPVSGLTVKKDLRPMSLVSEPTAMGASTISPPLPRPVSNSVTVREQGRHTLEDYYREQARLDRERQNREAFIRQGIVQVGSLQLSKGAWVTIKLNPSERGKIKKIIKEFEAEPGFVATHLAGNWWRGYTLTGHFFDAESAKEEIGRASCRERV
jgi:hypothetical protein